MNGGALPRRKAAAVSHTPAKAWHALCGSPAAIATASSFGIAELLTGSTRPQMLITSPVLFVLLVALYGCGVLTAWTLTQRWHGGWATLVLLGAAYGVLEEGLVARSFFDPHWADLGAMAADGRWLGVNWIWTVYLMIFHAIFTVTIPVALARITVPGRAGGPWLSRRGQRCAAAGLAVLALLGMLVVNPSAGSPILLFGAAVVMLVLGLLAWWAAAPRWRIAASGSTKWSPRGLALLGLGGSALLFILGWILPSLGMPAVIIIAGLIAAAAAASVTARHIARRPLDPRRQIALITGVLAWLALVDLALAPERPDTAALVILAATVIVWRSRRWRRQPVTTQ